MVLEKFDFVLKKLPLYFVHVLQVFIDKDENSSQAAKNVNNSYGPDIEQLIVRNDKTNFMDRLPIANGW